ncbi:MAG: response regulator [Thermoanaerobacteraceae bacterium]|nr:response regulator [Thermoanaerobacteraceae bacterium]
MYNKKVLVVDDQYWIRVMMKEVLSDSGFTTYIASSHTEAVEILKSDLPDIVILDVKLQDTDGFELLSTLRKIKSDIKAVFISGSPNAVYAQRAMAEGALRYFIKRFDIFEFATFLVEISSLDSASRGEGKWRMNGVKVKETFRS